MDPAYLKVGYERALTKYNYFAAFLISLYRPMKDEGRFVGFYFAAALCVTLEPA